MPVGGNFSSCNCGPDTAACESPTQPVATVGLCLADGSPIAVTVVRDCAGTVTSEGWIDLSTGAWSAGPPPAGTLACGDSRSITTNGTFCDVLEDGTVAGLVLVEYQYAADGSIDAVRLVDAVTGTTYTPQGEVTTCPAGVEAPERDLLQLCDVIDDESGALLPVPFVRDYQRSETGQITGHTDYTLDGQPYTPSGTVGVCQAQPEEPCASTVTVLRLCDLNPDVAPDEDGKRCAVPFLRHLVYDCTGALTETRDTTTDGTTPYTPVEAVDCGSGGGVPAMVEVPWEVVGIEPDPASAAGRGFVFTLSPIDDPSTVGTVTVTTTATANTQCPGTPPAYNFRNPCTYTFTPDQALQDAATYVRCDLQDFDTFEPVTSLTPPPDRLGGTAYWDGTTVRPTVSNGVGEMYYDGPPAAWSYRVGNTGGGNSCSALSFAAVSLRAEGCCSPCGESGGDGGRTVQEVCVIATAAPDDVMTWTRVIEDGGATIYYLDQDGARYDGTLPAGHQIVACPGEEPEPCRDTSTLLLCDAATGTEAAVPTVADAPDADNDLTEFPAYPLLAGSWAPLWTGGQLVFPQDPDGSVGDGNQAYRTVMGRITGSVPDNCGDASGELTVSVRVTNDGPNPGAGGDGLLRIYRNGVRLVNRGVLASAPVGHVQTLTATVPVTPADLASGALVVLLSLETFHGTPKSWTADQFTVSAEMAGCQVQFLRTVTTDCETGEVVAVTDTTLDGQPYTVTGEVGQCQPAAECCPPPPPEPRVDVETKVLCIQDEAGDITGQVLVENVYDDQSGERLEQRLTDPTSGDAVTLPAGAELVVCNEPACPVAFATECVGVVERTEASYDNTSLIGGLPGQCGGVQGPNGQFPCLPTTGGFTITSWLVDGEEVIGEGGGRTFAGGPCGQGTGTTPGMHLNWSQALTNLDPSGATWTAQNEPACAWFVGSTGGTQTTYGPMTVEDAAGQRWILTPAQGCAETQFTKVYTQDCDGAVSVSWLDADGVATDPPEGDRVPCGTGCGTGGGRGLDVEPLLLCDVAEDGTSTTFLRHLSYGSAGEVAGALDTMLDGFTPYTPTGTVTTCAPDPETRVDVETDLLCVRDTAGGDILGQVIVERVYDDQGGELVEQRVTDLAGAPYTLPAGAELTKCPSPDRITRQVCVVESGSAEFLTNEANATSGQDPVWQWAPNLTGLWHPMYRVAPNGLWTATDTAPNTAHWVSPHANRTVCPTAAESSPPVPGTWYTRASWNLPANVDPDTIRVAATILNADNKVVQWRLNDGAWQPVGGGTLANPAWTFPPTAVPGGRAGQNEVVVQILETQPAVTCPSGNEAGMILHVIATYDYEPRVWTQVIEPGGQTYYLDENGDRQDSIPAGHRLVACGGGGGGDAPCCPSVTTEPVALCDVAEDGTSTAFLRHFTYTEGTDVPAVRDTALDGTTPYTPTGTVGSCQPDPGPDVELLDLCDVAEDGTSTAFLRHLVYPAGAAVPTVLDTGLDGTTPYTVTGEVGVCPAEEECPSRNVLSACRWDDTDGDGIADTEYVELLAVDCEGVLTSVGTYLPDLSAPYTPTSPVDGDTADPGPEPAVNVQAHRVEVAPGGMWDAASVPALRSVTLTAHSGNGEITTADGTSTLFPGESVTWSVDKELDAALVGPLSVTAGTGTVTVTWTRTA